MSGSDTAQLRNDVAQYTEAFVEAGGNQDESFFSGLGDLARKRGLGRTDVNDAQRTAYQAAWSGGDAERQSAMARGFAKAR